MITITGATGNTGSKIANLLLDDGHKIRVIGRSEDKLKKLKERGAETAIGDQGDVVFLTKAFKGSDAIYLMIPPKLDTSDVRAYYNTVGEVAVKALNDSGVKKVVVLSSMGAELISGTGPVLGLHDLEAKLGKLTQFDIAILRPAYFMENLLNNIQLIKHQHINGNTLPPDAIFPVIATRDISNKAKELLTGLNFKGHTIIELFGDRISYREATRQIGLAIGKPDLPYVQFTPEDTIKSMMTMGLSENIVKSFIEMGDTIAAGLVHPTQIDPSTPNTSTTFKTFAVEVFKPLYDNAT
jgi:uncharacterized protein YbjT (DUF2867 family)